MIFSLNSDKITVNNTIILKGVSRMNFFKRALLSIKRRKGKSIILFLIVFILGNLMAGAIAIEQGTKGVEKTIKNQLGATATVGYDDEKLEEAINSGVEFTMEEPSVEVYQKIGELPQVKISDYSINDFAQTIKIKNVNAPDGSYMRGDGSSNYFDLRGASRVDTLDEQLKKITISDGRTFSEEEIKKGSAVGLISDQVAKENNLHVGDKMVLDRVVEDYSSVSDDIKKESKDYPIEIIGVYKVNEVGKKSEKQNDEQQMNNTIDLYDRLNVIYLPNNYIEKTNVEMLEFSYDTFPGMYMDEEGKQLGKDEVMKDFSYKNIMATYILNDPKDVEDFKLLGDQILKENKLDYSKIVASSDQFDSVAGPIQGMSKIAKVVLIVSIIVSIFIISLVTILFLRDRKHELGIYLALGEKREKIIGQVVIEVLIVSLVAMTLSVFSGNYLAKGFSDSLIRTQQTVDDGMMMGSVISMGGMLNEENVTEEDVIEAYEIHLTPSYIAIFYLVGLIVILLSTIVPLIYIMRLNPKTIMM